MTGTELWNLYCDENNIEKWSDHYTWKLNKKDIKKILNFKLKGRVNTYDFFIKTYNRIPKANDHLILKDFKNNPYAILKVSWVSITYLENIQSDFISLINTKNEETTFFKASLESKLKKQTRNAEENDIVIICEEFFVVKLNENIK